jgi:hypothetical protein
MEIIRKAASLKIMFINLVLKDDCFDYPLKLMEEMRDIFVNSSMIIAGLHTPVTSR